MLSRCPRFAEAIAGLVAAGALLGSPLPMFAGTAVPVVMDGSFADWRQVVPLHDDPDGDGREGGVDLGRLHVANDQSALYLRLEVGGERLLQSSLFEAIGNALRLYLDLDGSPATGKPEQGLGVDLEIRFGERQAVVYDEGGREVEVALGATGIESSPVHSASEFEIRIPFAAAPEHVSGEDLATGDRLELLLEEEATGGDRLPDVGTLAYETSPRRVGPPNAIPLDEKAPAKTVRLLVMNVLRTTIADEQEVYTRILRALAPDLIAFQEVLDWSAGRTRQFVARALPLENGRRWSAARVADTVTVSSYPILDTAAVDGNLVAHIDLPDEKTAHDLVLFNAHTPCCDNDAGRDLEHDDIAAAWRDLLAGTGPFPIGPRDAVVMAGDFNMVGFVRQLRVLRDGTFIDPANGPDFAPGRGKGSLKVAKLRHTHARTHHTWRRATSEFSRGKLDYVFFSNDVAKLKRGFVLDTGSLPAEVLEAFGLERDDSLAASDHLGLVVDLRFRRR